MIFKNILVTGARGNVGSRLVEVLSARGIAVHGIDIQEVDITDFAATTQLVQMLQPDLVIHCAALTDVDRCAREPELALRINGVGAQNVALASAAVGAATCHISTNEVFDGQRGTPYSEYDATRPINPYGYSKWFAEQAIRDIQPQHFIVRTSWIFAHGGTNFLQKIMQRAAKGESLSVVVNEIGCPTYAEDFVEGLVQLLEVGRFGIYHLTNEGHTSRHAFARHILDCYGFTDVPIKPVISAQFPRPSRPPEYGALRNFVAAQIGIKLRAWQEAVSAFVAREQAAEKVQS